MVLTDKHFTITGLPTGSDWAFSVFLKDTSTFEKEEPGTKPPSLQLVDNLLDHLKLNSLKYV